MALVSGPELSGRNIDGGVGDGDGEPQDIFCDINITPFTDVILVLLIIFMVSSSAMVDAAREGRLDVTLPQAGHTTPGQADVAPLVIGLTADGRVFARGQFLQGVELKALLAETHAKQPDTVVIVDADGTLPHSTVVQVIDEVRAAGFGVVGIGAESSR